MNASLSRAAQGRPTKPAYAAMIVCLAAAFGLAASIAPAHADPEKPADDKGSKAVPLDQDPQQPLTEKLKKGKGVVKPPAGVDPNIEKQPPSGAESNMPVIVPPEPAEPPPPKR